MFFKATIRVYGANFVIIIFCCVMKYSELGHEDVREGEGIAVPFLFLAVDGGERPTSCPGRFNPRKEPHLIGDWLGRKARMDTAE
jgi:hypothetical protein